MSRLIRPSLVVFALLMGAVAAPSHAQRIVSVPDDRADGVEVYRMTVDWSQPLSAALDSAGVRMLDAGTALAVAYGQYDASRLVHLEARRLPSVEVRGADYEEVRLPAGDLPEQVREVLSAPPAEAVALRTVRRRSVANLQLALLRYDAATETLRRYRRLEVAVRLPQAEPGARAAAAMAARLNPHLAVDRSALADGLVLKFPVAEEGVYRITPDVLGTMLEDTGVEVEDVDPRQLQLFGNGGRPLPALNAAPRPADLVENPVVVTGAADGSFDEGDALLFHADDVTSWTYVADDEGDDGHWEHVTHPSARVNTYFLKVGSAEGARVREVEVAGPPDATLTAVPGRHVVDFEDFMWALEGHGSGLTWTSRQLIGGSRLDVFDGLRLPGLATGTVDYEARVAARTRPARGLRFEAGGRTLGTVTPPAIYGGSDAPAARARTGRFTQTVSQDQAVELEAVMESGGGEPTGAVDWVRAFYTQRLVASGGVLRFTTPAGQTGALEFVLRGFATTPRVWDVTHPGAVQAVPVSADGDAFRVRVRVDDPAAPREIVAFTDAGARTLEAAGAQTVPNQNLHGLTGHPELVIVAPAAFVPLAEELAERRRAEGLEVLVADVEAVYNEFSGGVPDMRAVRDFLRFLYDRGPDPSAPALEMALLFGDGHFNHRGIGSEDGEQGLRNHILPYETVDSFDHDDSYTSDDYFALLDEDEGVWRYGGYGRAAPSGEPVEGMDIGIGRLPVQTEEEARAVLDKIYRYEARRTAGAWRARYLFVADDGYNGLRGNNEDSDLHVKNAEAAVDVVATDAPAINLRKIYGPTYDAQRVYTNGFRIPAMKQDVLAAIHDGVLVFNYSGHGSPDGLMQERVFTMDDAEALRNGDRLPIFITATCSFGRWDMETQQSGAELALLNPEGGAVAVFTTVRIVYTSSSDYSLNPGLNRALNRALFARDAEGRPRRLGTALLETKNTSVGLLGNSRKFNLLGDPSMRIGFAPLEAHVTEVNGATLSDSTEAALRAIERATIRGEVRRADGAPARDFDGTASVEVYDAARYVRMPYGRWMPDSSFLVRDDLIWRGDVAVRSGRFETEFVVPKDISYRDANGRIVIHARSELEDALGFTEAVRVGGSAAAAPDDREGPRIDLYLNDTTFVSGALTPPDPQLIVRLYDDHGVNAVGAGVGHELLLVVNGEEEHAVDLGPRYTSEENSFRSGRVEYELSEYARAIEPGPNHLRVRAWDVLNNSSEAELEFFVSAAEDLELRNVYNYPNPTGGPTYFLFEHNQPPGTVADVQVRIYTLSGRPVRTLEGSEALPSGMLNGGPVRVPQSMPWDGLDADGDPLAPGVYLYKLRVETEGPDGDRQVSERIERLAVIR